MNRCGYDYVTLGNHDFNYGMAYLDSYLDALHARCVCQNVRRADGSTRFPARVHTLENGLRVGIVGIVTDYVNIWERPDYDRSPAPRGGQCARGAERQRRSHGVRLSRRL